MDTFKHKENLRMDNMHSRPDGARPRLEVSRNNTNASMTSNDSRPTPCYRQESNRTMSKLDYPSSLFLSLCSDYIIAPALFLMLEWLMTRLGRYACNGY